MATPSPIHTPTPDAIWPEFPDPIEESEIAIPEPVPPIEFNPDTVNIVLLGTDRRPTWKWYQTDAIVVVSLNLESKEAVLISIPRDLYVYIPGWRVNRINTAEYRGGFEMIANTIRYNFGIPVHHWVRVEFWGFSEAVDLLGGIEIQPNRDLESMCEGVPYEYEEGRNYSLDGFASMCYVRMRMNSSDFDRLRRQEEVIRALFDRVVSIDGFLKIPQLYDTFTTYVDSDLTLGDILPWIPSAAEFTIDPTRIHFYRIDNTMVENWRTPLSNQAVLIPKRELIQGMLDEAFAVP
jgi:LCP family protein required for cell wall assembly